MTPHPLHPSHPTVWALSSVSHLSTWSENLSFEAENHGIFILKPLHETPVLWFKSVLRFLLICSAFSSTTADEKWWLDNFDILIKCPRKWMEKSLRLTLTIFEYKVTLWLLHQTQKRRKNKSWDVKGVKPTYRPLRHPERFPHSLNDATEEAKVAHLEWQTTPVTWSPLHQLM